MNIMVLVNKDFEYAGYQAGIFQQLLDKRIPDLHVIAKDTGTRASKFVPSCVYKLGADKVREFCISYLFDAGKDVNTSNSEEKHDLLKELLKEEKPDLIISVSTTETTPIGLECDPKADTKNGCVFMGSQFFAKDCRKYDSTTKSHLYLKEPWYRLDFPPVFGGLYDFIHDNQAAISEGMLQVPNHPAAQTTVYADEKYVSLGVINVMNYDCYGKADAATYEEFNPSGHDKLLPIGLETTHAVVRMAAEEIPDHDTVPVLFVSPIVDRYECFNEDVGKSWDEQNFISSYNSAIAVSNMLQLLMQNGKLS